MSSLLPSAPIQQNGRKSRKLYAVPNKETKPSFSLSINRIKTTFGRVGVDWHRQDRTGAQAGEDEEELPEAGGEPDR